MSTEVQKPALPTTLALLLSMVAGLAIAAQGRVNGALALKVEHPIYASLISFTVGFIVLLSFLTLKNNRAAMSRVLPVLKARKFPWFYLGAGIFGAYFVISQAIAAPLLGIALYTVAVVTGQTLGGLVVDLAGFGPAGRKYPTVVRVIGALLTVVAVFWTVSDRLVGPDAVDFLPLILPFLAGFVNQAQQAMNGIQTMHYSSPYPGTVFNFVAGTLFLFIVWFADVVQGTPVAPLPTEWWYYLGGPLGVTFVGLGALLVRRLGVLVLGMGMIAGQLLGSLLIDVLFPAPGTALSSATYIGTLLTFVAVLIASTPRGGFGGYLRLISRAK
ncbi:DMT family transporter [Micrococcoides hystricis]|uniref:DMT family transporter n=1 Tax=Micrococcoides hystricis TaxID=1572761 RepID=A0ABV6PAF3_9MICC